MRAALLAVLLGLCSLGCGGDDGGGGSGGADTDGGVDGSSGSGGSGGAGGGGSGGGGAGGTAGQGGTGGTGGSAGASGSGGSAGSGCTAPGDCPAPSTECLVATCDSGICGTSPVASGTPAQAQTSADCKRVECDGAGATQDVPDDTDVSDDTKPCTVDSCSAGNPVHTPLAVGTACNGGGLCDAQGECVACLVASDCGTPTECSQPTCTNGTCGIAHQPNGTPIQSQTSGDCLTKVCDGSGAVLDLPDASDLPNDNNDCTADTCDSGTAVHTPTPNQPCGTSGVCNAQGQCVGCNVASDCAGTDDFCKTRTCTNNVCGFSFTAPGTPLPGGSQTSGDCKTQVCDGQGAVQAIAANDPLVDGNACTLDQCAGTTPQNPPTSAGTPCASGGGKVCNGSGACVACLTAADCGNPTGYPCVVGTCVANQCGKSNAGPGTPCGGGTCSAGTAELPDQCNGSGTCVDGGTQSCSPYVCGPSACTTSCASDAGCSGGTTCDTGIGICTSGPKCTPYCNTIMSACAGSNQQYFSLAACLETCEKLPKGTASDAGGNSVGCRTYHAGAAVSGPVVHCPHAGPAGAGVCGGNCESFCSIALGTCTGSNQIYASLAACTSACAAFPTTPPYNTSVTTGDSFACRMYHLTAATLDPVVHCPHIAPASQPCGG